jgi:hypothetical protein
MFHLAKITARKELEEIYSTTNVTLKEHLFCHPRVMNHKGSMTPEHLPYLFFFMDSEAMFENALTKIVGRE